MYYDSDGDRKSGVGASTCSIFDTIIALAYTFQHSSSMNTTLTDPEYLAIRESKILKESVSFDGISGPVSFNSIGDRNNPQMSIYNTNKNGKWTHIGSINLTSIVYTSHNLTLPLGVYSTSTFASEKLYGKQVKPVCPAGSQPNLNQNGLYICSLCGVGEYKYVNSSDACIVCPKGGDCNGVGTVKPCTLPGYWYVLYSQCMHFLHLYILF